MTTDVVLCDRQASHWTITLNRPEKRNALSADLVQALLSTVQQARAQHIPVLVLQGAGKNLSAGFDFTGYEDHSEGDLLLRFARLQEVFNELLAYPGLTVGIAHGRNFGAGCDLFASCQMRLAPASATFRMPGMLFGLVLGTRRFGQLVGESHAARLLLAAQEFDAQEAHRIGFVTELANPDQHHDWPALAAAVGKVHAVTRQSITEALSAGHADADMGKLVQSVIQGDIKRRIANYLNPAS
ncbi:MAG: enoyl-CoA hydratase/isomerase family protein [Burkholderiaceae bacterium]